MEKELTGKLFWYLFTQGLLAWVQISFPLLTLKLGQRGDSVSGKDRDPSAEYLRGSEAPSIRTGPTKAMGAWQGLEGLYRAEGLGVGYSHHSLVRALGAGGVAGDDVVSLDPSHLEVEAALVRHGRGSWGDSTSSA